MPDVTTIRVILPDPETIRVNVSVPSPIVTAIRVTNVPPPAANVSVTSAELQSVVNIVSNAVSNEISARQSASAALETHINAVSARGASISAELNSLLGSVEQRLSARIDAASAVTGTFLSLTDTPDSFSGQAGKIVAVKGDETSLEFIQPPPPSSDTRLISGGVVVWTGTGFDFTVSSATYLINGVQYTSPDTNKTLSPADLLLDRIDVFAVDDTGSVIVIEGVPGGPPVEPQVDPASQLALTHVLVEAGSSTPTITNEDIYHEDTEYTASTNSGNFVLNSTNNPHGGTKDVEATNAAAGNYVQFVKPAAGTINLSSFSTLIFYIRSKAAWPTKKGLSIFWMNGATNVGSPVTLKSGTFGFDSSNTSSYQLIAIPTTLFSVAGVGTVTTLRMTVAGGGAGTIGFYLDDIILQAGVNNQGGVTKFTDLQDVPGSYSAQSLKFVRVKSDETGLEFASAAATGSVTSTEVAALVDAVSNAISNEISARHSASAALETHINAVSAAAGAGSVTSTKVSAGDASVLAAAIANDASVSAAIRADEASHIASTSATIKADINSVSAAIIADVASHIASTSAAIKTDVVSAINVLSNLASNWVSAAFNASTATSSPAISNAASNVASVSAVIKTDIASVSAAIRADEASHIASTSATIKADINSVSAAIMADVASHLASTSATIKTDINSVSAAIMADVASHLTSALGSFSVRSVGNVSTKGLQSVLNALSNRISVASGGGGAGSVTSTELSVAQYLLNTTQTDTDYTLVLGDANTEVKMSSGSAHNLTVPPNSSVAFPTGTQIVIQQAGAGAVTIVAGSGVTLNGGTLVTSGQYQTVVLLKEATDTWLVRTTPDFASLISTASAAATSVDARLTSVSAAIAAASTAGSIAALSNAISNDASVSAALVQFNSVGRGSAQYHVVTGAQNLSATFGTKVSGLSLSLQASKVYIIEGQVNFQPNGASATAVFQLGMSATVSPTYAQIMWCGPSAAAGPAVNSNTMFGGDAAISTTPSVQYSVRPATSGIGYMVYFNGVIQQAATQTQLKLVCGATTTNNGGCTIRVGSFIRAYQIT